MTRTTSRLNKNLDRIKHFIRHPPIGRILGFLSLPVVLLLLALWEPDRDPPIFDVQVHYNADSWEGYSAQGLVRVMKRFNVPWIVVSSTPNEGTARMFQTDSTRVIPMFVPYRDRDDRDHWLDRPDLVSWVRQEISLGRYRGIGEFHLYEGRVDLPAVRQLVELAVERDLVLSIHGEPGVIRQVLGFDRRARVLWAHAGLKAPVRQVSEMMELYSNLYAELSHRGDVAPDGQLSQEWRSVFERYPDRFMIGVGTYNNEFWHRYSQILELNREWLRQLPKPLMDRIAFQNAQDLFSRK